MRTRQILALCTIAAGCMLASAEASADPTCVTLKRVPGTAASVVADTYIANDPTDPTRASSNYGSVKEVHTGYSALNFRRGLYRFDLSSIPPGSAVASSTLTIRKAESHGNPVIDLHAVLAPWNEQTVTWTSFADAFSPTVLASFATSAVPTHGYATLDLTSITQQWLSGAMENNGVLLDQTGGGRALFGGSEAPVLASRPQLEVCYTSDHCAPNPCQNGAGCLNDAVGYTCMCAEGYSGTNCEIAPAVCPCLAQPEFAYILATPLQCSTALDLSVGSVVGMSTYYPGEDYALSGDLFGDGTLACLAYFDFLVFGLPPTFLTPEENQACVEAMNLAGDAVGLSCPELNECDPDPCQNGGTCNDYTHEYYCSCPEGFTGQSCELLDPCAGNSCMNGSSCERVDDTSYTCACSPGFEGAYCEIDIDDCASQPCQNGGSCTDGVNDYTCACVGSWLGKSCERFGVQVLVGAGAPDGDGYTCATIAQNSVAFFRDAGQTVLLSNDSAATSAPFYDEVAILTVTSPSGQVAVVNVQGWDAACADPSAPILTVGDTALDITSVFGAETGTFTVDIEVRNINGPAGWPDTFITLGPISPI